MAVNEYNVLMRYKDAAGDTTLLYPITKQENITTEGDGAAYTADVASIIELKNGVSFVMIPHVDSTSTSPTLNVNNLGAKRIRRRISSSTGTTSAGASEGWLVANKPIRVVYDGSFWIAELAKPNATDLFGVTPIESGGTGASTAEGARANILPAVTSEDEGKNLRVSEDGVWVVGKTSGLATVYVTAPAGVTVTATKDDEIVNVVANTDGLAIFDGLSIGTWTISISNDLQTQTRTVYVGPDYTTSIKFFEATINVNYPSGSTCTCSNGDYTFTAPNTSGSHTFTVFKTGTWTIKITDGTDTDSEDIYITADDQSENVTMRYFASYIVVTYPSGSTCTCSDGSTTLTASDTSGSYTFRVKNTGTWTVHSTDGNQEDSTTVSITGNGQSTTVTLKYFAAYITVTYPSGSTCTCSDGETTLTATSTSGSWLCKVPNTGTWTVTSTNGSQTTSTTVSISTDGQSESVTLTYFAATIAVTYPEGSTCTCSDGSTTLIAPDTSGSYTFTVPNAGTWTVSCTDGDNTDSQAVTITTNGESQSVVLGYTLWLYKDGVFHDTYTMSSAKVYNSSTYKNTYDANVTNADGVLTLYTTKTGKAGYSIGYATDNKIDMSKYSTLKINITSITWGLAMKGALCVATARDGYIPNIALATIAIGKDITEGELTLDISEVNDETYVVICIPDMATYNAISFTSLALYV